MRRRQTCNGKRNWDTLISCISLAANGRINDGKLKLPPQLIASGVIYT